MKFWFLHKLELFEGMSPEQRQRIGALLTDRTYRVGEVVVRRLTGDRVFILKSGRVLVMNGDVALNVIEAGHLFGTAAFADMALPGQRVVALDDVIICEAPAAEFLAEMAEHPPAAKRMVRLLADQMVGLQQQIERSATEPVQARLADLLVRLARDEAGVLTLRTFTEADIGSMIGASRESVSRLIARWERDGSVHRGHGWIEIRDAAALRDQANLSSTGASHPSGSGR